MPLLGAYDVEALTATKEQGQRDGLYKLMSAIFLSSSPPSNSDEDLHTRVPAQFIDRPSLPRFFPHTPKSRTIYLAVFSKGLSPVHHAVFIPESGKERRGKVTHVTGNVATGFWLEFKRN